MSEAPGIQAWPRNSQKWAPKAGEAPLSQEEGSGDYDGRAKLGVSLGVSEGGGGGLLRGLPCRSTPKFPSNTVPQCRPA